MRCRCPQLLLAFLLSITLSACGGGGGSDGGDGPTQPPTSRPPVPEVPQGSSGDPATLDKPTYTGIDLDAFEAINAARTNVGLAPVKQNTSLDKAAQGHVRYQGLNSEGGHYQTEGKPGFTGRDPWDRMRNAGYKGLGDWTEGISGGFTDTRYHPIDSLLSGVYHRVPLLSAETVDVGIGQQFSSQINVFLTTVINYGTTAPDKHYPNEQGYWVWPYDGAKDLKVSYGEIPNPAPDFDTLGYAISVSVNPGDTIEVEAFSLNCGGQDLPARIITSANDVHNRLKPNWAFLQPDGALPYESTCVASFAGSSTKLGRFNKTWSFTTVKAPFMPEIP